MPKKQKQKPIDSWQKGYIHALRDQVDKMRDFLGELDELLQKGQKTEFTIASMALVKAAELSEELTLLAEGGR